MLRIGERILHLTPPPHSRQPTSPSPPSQLARRTLPPPAAKRFVQETFRIGFAMRKVLSVFLDFTTNQVSDFCESAAHMAVALESTAKQAARRPRDIVAPVLPGAWAVSSWIGPSS